MVGKIDAIALKGSCHEGLLGAVADEAASSVVNAIGAMADEVAAGAAGCCFGVKDNSKVK